MTNIVAFRSQPAAAAWKQETPPNITLDATPDIPVTIYYCKAGIANGQTVRVSQFGPALACSGVRLTHVSGEMIHGDSKGTTKASGARCVLTLTAGTVEILP